MSQSITVQTQKSDETDVYTVYNPPEDANGVAMGRTYMLQDVAEKLGEYVEFEISTDTTDGRVLTRRADVTGDVMAYSSKYGIIESTYISVDVLLRLGVDSESPISLRARASSQESFEAARPHTLDSATGTSEESLSNSLSGGDE